MLEVGAPKNFEQGGLVGVYPLRRRQSTGCGVCALGKLLFIHERYEASEKALDEVQDVTYGRYDKALSGKDVTVENHLPLNAPLRGEEG